MREIVKTLSLPVDGISRDFRITKFDAFSGCGLLRLALKYLPENGENRLEQLFTALPEPDLRSLMTTALNHTEVLLPAGYQRVMTGGEWGWEELEHDAPACLRLTVENVLWSLSGFFGGAGRSGRSDPPDGCP